MSSNEDYAYSVASAINSSMNAVRRKTRASVLGDAEGANGADISISGRRVVRSNAGESSTQSARGGGVVEVTDEMVEGERARLLVQKQTELDQTFNRHDDLIREQFHMQNWKTMLAYDPQMAKTDQSQVFREFKAEYDLLRIAEPTAGSSRQTRRAASERKKIAVAAISSVSAPPGALKSSKPRSKYQKPTVETWKTPSISARGDGKGKGKEIVAFGGEEEDVSHTIRSLGVSRKSHAKTPLKKFPRRTGSSSAQRIRPVTPPVGNVEEGDSIIAESRTPNGLKRTRSTLADELPESASHRVPEKRRRQKPAGIIVPPSLGACSVPEPDSISVGRTLRQRPPNSAPIAPRPPKSLPPVPLFQEVDLVETPEVSSSLNTPKRNIKRVTLIVRRPVPTYTNPDQRPDPKFHESLQHMISSHTTLNVGQETIQREAKEQAAIREREMKFRRQERFIPGTDVFFGTDVDPDDLPPPYQPPKRESKDLWDAVIESVVALHKLRAVRKVSLGKQVAGQVAARVQAYWDAQGVKKGKARAQEEKRLRGLAKSTMKMVINEWKRAVYHIREQERKKKEEEERRRGHEHLDAILDQSGQLLSTQQSELKRGEIGSSRASSVRFAGWGDDSDDESDGDDGSEDGRTTSAMDDADVENFSEDDEEDAQDDLGANSTMLLMGTSTPAENELSSPEPPSEPPELSPQPILEYADEGLGQLEASQPAQKDSDESDIELEYPPIPNPGTSPVQPMHNVLPRQSLVDYASSSARSPSAMAQEHDVVSEPSPSPSPLQHPIETPVNPSLRASPNLLDEVEAQVLVQTEKERELLPREEEEMEEEETEVDDEDDQIPDYLKPFAVAPVERVASQTIAPLLLRGVLRPYQQSGLEWLASLHTNNLNGILADEMGLGKTIQTIALLAHLACDHGIWGPHLIVVPTSVLLNWEMEFKKFLPGFKVLSYHGSTKRRKELRQGWMDKYHFNVCITSYTLASKDQHIFKRKAWYYMILDEAHMIKNFRSQRWSILLMFRSFRRLLLTGTPLQNNLTELWALLQFLMSGSTFANLKEFGDWFSNPLEKAIEMGQTYDEETLQRVSKLHTVLRPYLLRRLKRDVEKELPQKYEHLLLCPLSKRQRFLYDEFMSRGQTMQDLQSGVYQKIANILMQLRKVCNHPDLFEVRPIVTSFATQRSAVADFEIKELLIRRRWIENQDEAVNLDVLHLRFTHRVGASSLVADKARELEATSHLPFFNAVQEDPPPKDTRTVAGFRWYAQYQKRAQEVARWSHIGYLNRLRCNELPIYSQEKITRVSQLYIPLLPLSNMDKRYDFLDTCYRINAAVKSYEDREVEMSGYIDRFAFATPAAVALDVPRIAFGDQSEQLSSQSVDFDQVLHRASVKLQIAFPDPSLLQYDCGKLQKLAELLRDKKLGGHRILIFTQMTRILDILEIFLSFHGYLYLRLDGATKIEDRQYITERFNADPRVFCFIASSRSGGVGINLTGADTVVFYDSDFNPQMDRQCEDRAHRIGQIRDVHIYRFVSQHTVEEAMLRKANQKRSLDDLVIQRGEFDWRSLLNDEGALTKALGECDDVEDARAAELATKEAFVLEGADEVDFGDDAGDGFGAGVIASVNAEEVRGTETPADDGEPRVTVGDEEEEEGGTTVDYMVSLVERDYEFFRDWKI